MPEALRRELRDVYGDPPGVPASHDEAILGHARQHFARRRRLRLVTRWAGAGAVAAGILVAIWLPTLWPPRAQRLDRLAQAPPPATAPQVRQVTILDAFAIARALESGAAVKAEWDSNRDGVVDRRDVDAVAAVAVRLDREAS